MNQMKIFTVLDVKVGAFSKPFFSRNNETAIRDFKTAVNDPQSPLGKYAEDYVLHEIGHWDEDQGMIHAFAPIVVTTAAAVLSGERG